MTTEEPRPPMPSDPATPAGPSGPEPPTTTQREAKPPTRPAIPRQASGPESSSSPADPAGNGSGSAPTPASPASSPAKSEVERAAALDAIGDVSSKPAGRRLRFFGKRKGAPSAPAPAAGVEMVPAAGPSDVVPAPPGPQEVATSSPVEKPAAKLKEPFPSERPPGAPVDPWTAFLTSPERPPGLMLRATRAFFRSFIHEYALAIYAGLLLAAGLTWPTLRYPLHTLPQDLGDPARQAWQVSWIGHILLTHPQQLWQSNAFYPEPNSFAFGDSLLGYGPIGMLGDGPVAATLRYNILFVLAHALLAIGGYALVRQLGAGRTGAAVAAVAIAYAPWRLAQEGHLDIISAGGIPLALAMLARGHGWSLRRGLQPRERKAGWAAFGWLVAAWQVSLGFSLGLPFLGVLGLIVLLLLFGTPLVWSRRRSRRLAHQRQQAEAELPAGATAQPLPAATAQPTPGATAQPASGAAAQLATGAPAQPASVATAQLTPGPTRPVPGSTPQPSGATDQPVGVPEASTSPPGSAVADPAKPGDTAIEGKRVSSEAEPVAVAPADRDAAPADGKPVTPAGSGTAPVEDSEPTDPGKVAVDGGKPIVPTDPGTVPAKPVMPADPDRVAGHYNEPVMPADPGTAAAEVKPLRPTDLGEASTVDGKAVGAKAGDTVVDGEPVGQAVDGKGTGDKAPEVAKGKSRGRWKRKPAKHQAPKPPRVRTAHERDFFPVLGWRLLIIDAFGPLILAGVAALIALPYFHLADKSNGTAEIKFFSPPLWSLLVGPAESRIWGGPHAGVRSSLGWAAEMSLLPGFVLYALALAGLWFSVWKFSRRILLILLLAASIVLTMGTHFFGGRWTYLPLFGHLPASLGQRIPGRMMLWVTLLLGLLAAGAVAEFVRRAEHWSAQRIPPWPAWWLRLATLVPLILVAVEGWNTTAHPVVPAQPASMRTITSPMLVLPTGAVSDGTVMLWSTTRYQKIANGSGGFAAARQDQMRTEVASFPDSASIQYLRSIHVTTVVLIRSAVAGTPWERAGDTPVDSLGITREDAADTVIFHLG